MFEIVFLGGIAAVIYRQRVRRGDWSRADLHRVLIGLGRGVNRGVTGLLQAGPGLVRQCAADMKSLVYDMTGMSRRRSVRLPRNRPGRLGTRPPGVATRIPAAAGAENGGFSRLQRRYIAGKISFPEYVEGVRRLQREGAEATAGRAKAPPRSGGEAGGLVAHH